jgi:hypothetical protein
VNLTIQANYFPENPVPGANNLIGRRSAVHTVSKTPYGISEINQIKWHQYFCCPGNQIHYDINAEFNPAGARFLLPDGTAAAFSANNLRLADEYCILDIWYFPYPRINISVLQHFNSGVTREKNVFSTLSARGLQKFVSDLQETGCELSLFLANTANLSARVPLTLHAFTFYKILLHTHRIVAEYTQTR